MSVAIITEQDIGNGLEVSGGKLTAKMASGRGNNTDRTMTQQAISTEIDKAAVPMPNKDSYLKGNSNGDKFWEVPPFIEAFLNTTEIKGLGVWFTSAVTSGKDLAVYPTKDGTESGSPIFSSILYCGATVVHNNSSSNDSHLLTVRSMSNNKIELLNVKGGISVIGGNGLRDGDSGKQSKIMVVGILA